MFFVYILYSEKDKNLYVGCTSDVKKRYEKHTKGHIQATKHRQPLALIHTESFENKTEAFQRERFLKSLWGAREKKKILNNFLKDEKVF